VSCVLVLLAPVASEGSFRNRASRLRTPERTKTTPEWTRSPSRADQKSDAALWRFSTVRLRVDQKSQSGSQFSTGPPTRRAPSLAPGLGAQPAQDGHARNTGGGHLDSPSTPQPGLAVSQAMISTCGSPDSATLRPGQDVQAGSRERVAILRAGDTVVAAPEKPNQTGGPDW
jgi:hypothetical protein